MNKETLLKEYETALRYMLKVRSDLDLFGLNNDTDWKKLDPISKSITDIAEQWKRLKAEIEKL